MRIFGFEHHPTFCQSLNKVPGSGCPENARIITWQTLERIVYRQDMSMKYEQHKEARKHHDKKDEASANNPVDARQKLV